MVAVRFGWVLLAGALVGGCAAHPRNVRDACAIFQDKEGWYADTLAVSKKWGVPIHVQLAIIHQESRFRYNAKPPRTRLFWFIPGPRPTTAFGYAQVLDGTWDWYRESTGNSGADRDDFGDAVDFIGWYTDISHKKLGISKWDAKNQYLAYHEGHGGYQRKTHLKKKWLLHVSEKVKRNAAEYRSQLARCGKDLGGSPGFWDLLGNMLWPFQ